MPTAKLGTMKCKCGADLNVAVLGDPRKNKKEIETEFACPNCDHKSRIRIYQGQRVLVSVHELAGKKIEYVHPDEAAIVRGPNEED